MVDTNIDKVIESYIKTRDKKSEITKRHKDELAPYGEALSKLENVLLRELNDLNLESFKGVHGTAFTKVNSSVKIIDWDTALDYALANDLKHVLERRLSKTAVAEFVKSEGSNFPGTDIVSEIAVQVRRK